MSVADPTTVVLEALERYPVVAIGEAHGLTQQHDWLRRLIADSRLPDRARYIVVEFGNALHQETLDGFLRGDSVPADQLRAVWRDTSQALTQAWEQAVYRDFFHAVREANIARAPERRLRVLLGDPLLDWTTLEGPEAYRQVMIDRQRFFAATVVEGVLAEGERALLIAGSGHFVRASTRAGVTSVVSRIEAEVPQSVFVMHPVVGFGAETDRIEPRLADWVLPSAVLLDEHWLGEVHASLGIGVARVVDGARPTPDRGADASDGGASSLSPPGAIIRRPLGADTTGAAGSIPSGTSASAGDDHSDQGPVLFAGSDLVKRDIAHALIYFGPRTSLDFAPVPPDLAEDEEYWLELEGRSLRATGRGIDPSRRPPG